MNIRNLLFASSSARTSTVKKNILGSLLIKGFSILISLALVPLTLGYVSSELYGIWLTLSSIMIWLNFFDVGFTLGLKNKLAEAIAKEDYNRGKSLVSTTYFILTLIFIPLCLILESIIPFINWATFLNVDVTYNSEIIKALYILVACFCLQMVVNVLVAVIAAFQKVALSSAFPVMGNFISLIFIYFLTKFTEPSLVYLAISISVIPIIVIVIASVYLYSTRFKQVAPSWSFINGRYIKDIFSLGAKFFLIQIQVVVLYQTTNVLISNVSGPEDVTAYNIAYKYMGIAMMVYTIILNPLWPAFTDAYVKKDFIWMKRTYKKMIIVYALTAFLSAVMVLLSPLVYNFWIGERAEIPFVMTITVAVYMLIHSWDTLQVTLINGIGCVKLQTYVTFIGLVLHIPLALFLGNYYGAIGVLFSMIAVNFIYILCFTTQINKILSQEARGIWLK